MAMSSSDYDSEEEKNVKTRLGACEVCGANEAKYTCPKCEVKTCCLDCVRIHRKELQCDGVRDRTKFIRVKNFTDTDLLSDYRLLEECARFVHAVKRDEKKRFTRIDKELPIHLYKLKMAARKRGTVLQFLAQNFTRHAVNTTKYNFKTNIIEWRVEWVFPNADPSPVKFVDEKCSEQIKLSQLLDKYLNPNAMPFEGSKSLSYYKSAGLNGVKILLKAEKVKSSTKKFFELEASESLTENLSGKCVIEFPTIFVVLKDHTYNFDIITPDDEICCDEDSKGANNETSVLNPADKTKKSQINTFNTNSENESQSVPKYHNKKRPRQLLTEKIAIEKKKEIELEIKKERKKRPKNLLFTTGYSSEDSINSESEKEEN